MVSLAILKGWLRWAATVVLGFYGIARISEVLRAFRGDFSFTFRSIWPPAFVGFSQSFKSKDKRRGKGRIQHLKLTDRAAISFLERAVGHLESELSIVSWCARCFPKALGLLFWWNFKSLSLNDLPLHPFEAVGAIFAYQKGESVQDILWRMRLSSLPTLEHYLQELAADSLMSRLPANSKFKIRSAAVFFPLLIEHPVSTS